MCGCFEIRFNFAETFVKTGDENYKPSKNYSSGGLEWAQLITDNKNEISIQHILIAGSKDRPYIIKHWRQDWLYQNTDFYMYNYNNNWNYVKKDKKEVKGQWTQKVFQVDDSPRYEGSGSWVHVDGKSYWENTTSAPLPRREYSKRSDYNVMQRGNRQEISLTGWVHDQNNKKINRKNGNKDIVLSYYNYGKQFPLRGFSCSAQQIPSLVDNFKEYDVFAGLGLKEIYGDELNSVMNLKAYEFSSLIFLNDGNGNYIAKELPSRAQFSSINDMQINDYNKDGISDILIIGNMHQVEIETPRNDAGIGALLLGTKNGKFEFSPLDKSGFFTPGDAKKIIEIETKDGLLVLVANNNDILQTFKLN